MTTSLTEAVLQMDHAPNGKVQEAQLDLWHIPFHRYDTAEYDARGFSIGAALAEYRKFGWLNWCGLR